MSYENAKKRNKRKCNVVARVQVLVFLNQTISMPNDDDGGQLDDDGQLENDDDGGQLDDDGQLEEDDDDGQLEEDDAGGQLGRMMMVSCLVRMMVFWLCDDNSYSFMFFLDK